MRAFVAVPLDDETRHRLAHLVREGVPAMPGHPVPPDNWHLTLRFLGEIDDPAVDRVQAALDQADLGEPFEARWGRFGAFPRTSRAGVLWIGIEDTSALHDLAERVEAALMSAGQPPADRPFRAHLTISRMRPEQDVSAVIDGVPPLAVAMRVDRIALFESRLGRGGAKYRVVEEFALGRDER